MPIKSAIVFLFLCSKVAFAYPQFQFTTDNVKCASCHYSPTGGGLINDWGREESADSISMGDADSFLGDPRALNGVLPSTSWFQLGADLRMAALVKEAKDETPRFLVFPMQADLYTRFAFGKFSVAVTAGVRGDARDSASFAQRLVSREHYVMWKQKKDDPDGYYARVGRFFPAYGLRLQDHTFNLRRRLGFNNLEEPYTASLGKVSDQSEWHLSGFVPSPVFQAGRKESGLAFLYEKRVGEKSSFGAQAKASYTDQTHRYLGGLTFKKYISGASLLLMGEVDVGAESYRAAGSSRQLQLLGHFGATYLLANHLHVSATAEYYDADVRLKESDRLGATVTLQWFPRAHWELLLMSRMQFQARTYSDRLHLLMLHYYL